MGPRMKTLWTAAPRTPGPTWTLPAVSHLTLETALQGHTGPILQMSGAGLSQLMPTAPPGFDAALNLSCPQGWPDAGHQGAVRAQPPP